MIDAPGVVIASDGDYAIVRMDETGCGRCHEVGGCGGKNIGQMFCSAPRTFRVLNHGHSAIGDHVKVTIPEGVVKRSAALAYGLPLLALFAGAFVGSAAAGETGAMIGAALGLLCAWLVLRFARHRANPDPRFQPRIHH